MPWSTPSLRDVRSLVRDAIRGTLPGADALVPNSVLRVLSDAMGALCHLVLQYIDWLALQLLPDTAETEWLDRHGDIWLVNADGTTGRKLATLAVGTAEFTGQIATVVPVGTQLTYATNIGYETIEEGTIGPEGVPIIIAVRALDPGAAGNRIRGDVLSIGSDVPNIDSTVTVIAIDGGADQETDEQLRMRVLQRIRQPPQGGATHDYIRWALAVPGCTRAFCSALEMGMGTVTVRVLFDDLRADNDGWPTEVDLLATTKYIDSQRPVAVKDFWVLAPVKHYIDVHIGNLVPDNSETRASIEKSVLNMLFERALPGQTIYAVWKAQAVMDVANVVSFDLLDWDDDTMPSVGHMAVLGDIVYNA
jgi:uncharacterized phage protein gp47/JayE